jgi:hypothetical protein
MWHGWGRRYVHTGLWWTKLKEREDFEDLGIDGQIILKLILKKSEGRAWNGLIWLRTSGWFM